MVESISQTVPVRANSGGTVTWLRYDGVVRLRSTTKPFKSGDSGAPCLAPDPDNPGVYRMACIFFSAFDDQDEDQDSSYIGLAIPAWVAQREMGITFGDLSQIYDMGKTFGNLSQITERGENVGTPAVTLQGFFGQRWVIDDYFQAGEPLHCGDVAVMRDQSTTTSDPKVYKATSSYKSHVIGIVHTPSDKKVGEQAATTAAVKATANGTTAEEEEDDMVPIVVKGIAQTLSAGATIVGEPVAADGSTGTPPRQGAPETVTLGAVARVVASPHHAHSSGVEGMTGDAGEHSHKVSAVSQGPQGPQGVEGLAGPARREGRPG